MINKQISCSVASRQFIFLPHFLKFKNIYLFRRFLSLDLGLRGNRFFCFSIARKIRTRTPGVLCVQCHTRLDAPSAYLKLHSWRTKMLQIVALRLRCPFRYGLLALSKAKTKMSAGTAVYPLTGWNFRSVVCLDLRIEKRGKEEASHTNQSINQSIE